MPVLHETDYPTRPELVEAVQMVSESNCHDLGLPAAFSCFQLLSQSQTRENVKRRGTVGSTHLETDLQ
jgi:hypothetical protein